jgi:NAD+ diphosphatase
MAELTPPAFIPAVKPDEGSWEAASDQPRGRCFAFIGAELLIARGPDEAAQIPGWEQLRQWDVRTVRWQYLGSLNGEPCWSAELPKDQEAPAGATLTGLRALYEQISEVEYALAGRAAQVVAWERDHQFCGRCGTPTEPVPGERARRCPVCELHAYPRLSPAVITLIERGDTVLLARGHAFQSGRFGIIAGFVEPGETLEEAVRREVREEVGIELERVEYFGSQPWPFPHGIMIGFRANYLQGEITLDDGELAEAGWYGLEDLPSVPGKLSIARQMIDDWATRRGAVIDQP